MSEFNTDEVINMDHHEHNNGTDGLRDDSTDPGVSTSWRIYHEWILVLG